MINAEDLPVGTAVTIIGLDASEEGVQVVVTTLEDNLGGASDGTPVSADTFNFLHGGVFYKISYSSLLTLLNSALTIPIANDAITYAKIQNVVTNQRALGRTSGANGDVEEVSMSTMLDWIGSTRGSVLYRGASGWSILTPGTSGYYLQSQGSGADPTWAAVSGGSAWTTVGSWVNGTAAANIDFTGLGSYTDIQVILEDVTLASSGIRNLQVGTGATPTWWTASGDYQLLSSAGAKSSASNAVGHSTGTTSARSVKFKIFGSGVTGGPHKIIELSNSQGSTMFVGNTDPITAVRVTCDGSINISAGSIHVQAR